MIVSNFNTFGFKCKVFSQCSSILLFVLNCIVIAREPKHIFPPTATRCQSLKYNHILLSD